MKAKALCVVLLSALLIWSLPTGTPVNNSTSVSTKVRTVQAAAPEKAAVVTSTALTEQKTDVEPEQVPKGCAAYVPLLQQYDWNYRVMAAVMQAESGCNPNANNQGVGNYDHIPDYGLMQLHGQEIYDPSQNIAHAYAIWQRQGYRAWSTYKNGAYLRYL